MERVLFIKKYIMEIETNSKEHPVTITIPYPEKPSRLYALFTLLFFFPKFIMLIPHLIVLYFIGIAAFFAILIAQVVVLFMGRYPRKLYDFIIGALRWQMRVNTFLIGLTDTYPPFTLGR